tara:strand:- start:660 stop:1082 length:423 start_codon:yes stop_codon:yes gene_type:complete
MTRTYAIGDLSRLTGVKVTTIRYYEHNGLMPEPDRAASGHRRYDGDALQRLGFIRQARELGFDLTAIRELLDLAADPGRPCSSVDSIAKRHVAAITEKIERLSALRGELQRVLDTCGSGQIGDCQVLQSIASRAGMDATP